MQELAADGQAQAFVWLAFAAAAPMAGLCLWLSLSRRHALPDPALYDMAGRMIGRGARLAAFVAGLGGWERAALAFSAGMLSVLAMAPFHLSPVLLVTLPVLVWLIDGAGPDPLAPPTRGLRLGRSALRAALSGWLFGFGYFLAGLYWIGEAFLVEAEVFAWLLPFAVTLLPAGLALFYALAAGLARLAWSRGLSRILLLSVAMALAEWLRGHILTGFPWNTFGYALTYPLPLMQTAAVLGIYGLTLWTVLIFSAPLVLWAEARPGRSAPALTLALLTAFVPLAILAAGGIMLLNRRPTALDEGARIRIVQPSIPQRDKWRPELQGANFGLHLDLSRTDAAGQRDDLAGVTHLIWPEAAMPFLPLERPEALTAISALLPRQTHLIAGALRVERPPAGGTGPSRFFNSLLVFAPGGSLAARYDKIHLVPFGEYLPFQTLLERIGLEQLTRQRGGFSAGETPRPLLAVAGLPRLSALICYEAVFPTEVIQARERPGLLVNVTNDGWFGNSIGPRQHLHQARVRAVEQGLPLLRSANNGISAVIDAQGRILHRLEMDQRGVIDTALPVAGAPTLYGRFGERIFAVVALVFLAWAAMLRPARKQAR